MTKLVSVTFEVSFSKGVSFKNNFRQQCHG
jgi:hypothetical protein